jgi:hypothetical protein
MREGRGGERRGEEGKKTEVEELLRVLTTVVIISYMKEKNQLVLIV